MAYFLGVVSYGQISQGFAQGVFSPRVKQPAPESDLPAFAADQLIVKFRGSAAFLAIKQLKAEHGATQIRKSESGGFITLSLPAGSDILKKAKIFSANPMVEYAHPNFFVRAHFIPNDPLYCLQWNFDDSLEWDSTGSTCQSFAGNPYGGTNGGGIRMEEAWDSTTGGTSSIVVAVLDTGAAYEDFSDVNPAGCYNIFGAVKKCSGRAIDTYFQAPDLASTNFLILAGSDLVNGDGHPNDDESHGTHVTGTIAQSTHNTTGVAGIVFNTTIMPVKVLDATGSGLLDVIADGIRFATDNGADVISMSLGSTTDGQAMRDAVQYAFDNGVTVVASAGNSFESGNPVNYPAAYDEYVIAVAATRYDEIRSYYSSTGSYVDIAAPGGDVTVDQNGDGFADGVLQQTFESSTDTSDFSYWFFQGTSMAAPHISGVAALLLAKDPSLTPAQVRTALESTAEDKGTAGRDDEYGWGIVDAKAALDSVATATVAINLTTDGITPFGVVVPAGVVDTTVSGTNDVQIVTVITGPVDLAVRSTNFSDGSNTWILAETNGADQVKWEFSQDGITWTIFSSAGTLFTFDINVAEGATRNLYLKLTTPTSSSSANEHSANVTFVATQP